MILTSSTGSRYWLARQTARNLVENLEQQADQNDDVPYGVTRVKFQTVRLLGVQGYLAAQWAFADRLVGMAGRVLCVRNSLQDPKNAPQFVSYYVRGGKGPESKIAAIAFYFSKSGWEHIEDRMREYKVTAIQCRLRNLRKPSAGDDLRNVLDICAREIDEALGVLVGSACQIAKVHVGFMLGED